MSESDAGAHEDLGPADPAPRRRPIPSSWYLAARRVFLGMIAGTWLAFVLLFAWLWPYIEDDHALDLIVRVVALDWRDFGEKRAQSRLQYELDHAGIGPWIDDSNCDLHIESERQIVSCVWGVVLEVPGIDMVLPMSFSSMARIDPQGDLN